MKAFVTGSHAYGTPNESSDIDLVALVSDDDLERLIQVFAESGGDEDTLYRGGPTVSLRFGSLNLLCVNDDQDYEVWREGTEELVARKPVTRDEAVALFKAKREAAKEASCAAGAAFYEAMDASDDGTAILLTYEA